MKACDFNHFPIDVVYREVTQSTNDDAKVAINKGATAGTVFVANCQTAGRGRQTKSFFSPSTGAYFSVILKPEKIEDTAFYTIYAALSVCEAVEKLYNAKTKIKWVNDIFIGGKKCAGILTEAVTAADGKLLGVVVGIGINVFYPEGGFPDDIKNTAGAVIEFGEDNRAELIYIVTKNLLDWIKKGNKKHAIRQYRKRSCILKKRIAISAVDEKYEAIALKIDDDGKLIVGTENGRKTLTMGDVSVCIKR